MCWWRTDEGQEIRFYCVFSFLFSGHSGHDLLLEYLEKKFSAGEVKETRKKNTLDTKTLPRDREQQALGAIFCLLNGIEIMGSNEAPRGISFC